MKAYKTFSISLFKMQKWVCFPTSSIWDVLIRVTVADQFHSGCASTFLYAVLVWSPVVLKLFLHHCVEEHATNLCALESSVSFRAEYSSSHQEVPWCVREYLSLGSQVAQGEILLPLQVVPKFLLISTWPRFLPSIQDEVIHRWGHCLWHQTLSGIHWVSLGKPTDHNKQHKYLHQHKYLYL